MFALRPTTIVVVVWTVMLVFAVGVTIASILALSVKLITRRATKPTATPRVLDRQG